MMAKKFRLGAGDVPIVLAGSTFSLRPTMRAGLALTAGEPGEEISKAITGVAMHDLEQMASVIGLGLDRRDLDELSELIWSTGTVELVEPLVKFLRIVANVGEPLSVDHDEEIEQAKARGEKLITIREVYEQWAGIAMGWLGWTEAEMLASDVNSIRVAYEAQMDKLKMCYGLHPVDPDQALSDQPLTPELFKAVWGGKVSSRQGSVELFDALFPG